MTSTIAKGQEQLSSGARSDTRRQQTGDTSMQISWGSCPDPNHGHMSHGYLSEQESAEEAVRNWHQGNLLLHEGNFADSISCYRYALSLRPDFSEAHNNLGAAFKRWGRLQEALVSFQAAVQYNPAYADAWRNLANTLKDLKRDKEAIAAYEAVLQLRHNDQEAFYQLAALRGETPCTAPAAYVKDVFDAYAPTFDRDLVETLGYRAPALLRELALADLRPNHLLEVLDLGCGTGLCGKELKDVARRLTGVDLSPKMLERARERGLYHELQEADLHEYLDSSPPALYDLVVAADVFTYIGNLGPAFAGVHRVLRPGGRFAFALEALLPPNVEAHDGEKPFILRKTARFAHSESYLRALAQCTGFVVLHLQEETLRKEGVCNEGASEIKGLVVVLQPHDEA